MMTKTEKRTKLRYFKKLLEYKCHIKNYESSNIPGEEVAEYNNNVDFVLAIIIDKIKLYYFGMTGDNEKPRETKEELMRFIENDERWIPNLRMSRKVLIALIKQFILK